MRGVMTVSYTHLDVYKRQIMRWQGSDMSQLPQALAERLGSGRYQRAAVGSCPAAGQEGTFTAYRVAVLLY